MNVVKKFLSLFDFVHIDDVIKFDKKLTLEQKEEFGMRYDKLPIIQHWIEEDNDKEDSRPNGFVFCFKTRIDNAVEHRIPIDSINGLTVYDYDGKVSFRIEEDEEK